MTASPGPSPQADWTSRDQQQPNGTTAYPIVSQELDCPPPQKNEETTRVSGVNQFRARPLNADLQLPNCKMGDSELQVEARHIQGISDDINPMEPTAIGELIFNATGHSCVDTNEIIRAGADGILEKLEDARVLPMCSELPSDVTPVANLEGPESSSEVCVANGLVASMVYGESAATTKEFPLLSMLVEVDLIEHDDVASHIIEKFEYVPALLLPVTVPPAASSLTASSITEVPLEPRATVYGSKAIALALNNHDSFTDSLTTALSDSTTASQLSRSLVTFLGDSKQRCEDLRLGAIEGVRIFDPGAFMGVETIQVTYSAVESGVDASHCGVTVLDATEMVAMFRILLYSMVANQSFVKIRVFDFAKFGETFAATEIFKVWTNRAFVVLVGYDHESGAQDYDHGSVDNYDGFFKKLAYKEDDEMVAIVLITKDGSEWAAFTTPATHSGIDDPCHTPLSKSCHSCS